MLITSLQHPTPLTWKLTNFMKSKNHILNNTLNSIQCLTSKTSQWSTSPERQLELHFLVLLQTKICEQYEVTNQIIAPSQLLEGGFENKHTKKSLNTSTFNKGRLFQEKKNTNDNTQKYRTVYRIISKNLQYTEQNYSQIIICLL